MTGPNFDAAVAFARAELEDTPWLTPEGGRKVLLTMLRRELALRSDSERSALLQSLVQDARENLEAHQAVSDLAAHLLENGYLVPKPVLAYILGVLRGETPTPTRRPGRQRTVTRDLLIQLVVYELHAQWGMTATANDASEQPSACDVVSEALRQIGIDIKPPAVAKIWSRRSLIDDFEIVVGIRNK